MKAFNIALVFLLQSPTGRVKSKAVGVLRCSECVEIDENDPPSA